MRVLNRDGNFASRFRTGQGTGNDSVCSAAGGQVFRLYSGIVVAGYWLCLGIAVFVQDLGFDVDRQTAVRKLGEFVRFCLIGVYCIQILR